MDRLAKLRDEQSVAKDQLKTQLDGLQAEEEKLNIQKRYEISSM